MGMVSQSLNDFKSLSKPREPKKVQEYKEKAKKAMVKRQYKKAYKYLHKAKTYKVQSFIVIDECWMI
jgi:hypothetical protein